MRKGSLDAGEVQIHGPIRKRSVTLDGVTVTEVTFGPGARWSLDLAAKAGTKSCTAPHVALVLSGSLRVRMDDGSEEEFSTGDVMLLPPGHDAWTVGAAPCVFVDFSDGYARYGMPESGERLG
jgi:quercetin dioxygenase-like cupin family protein